MLRHNVWTGHIPRPIWIIGLILVFACTTFGLTLKEEAEVTTDQIYLKDIIIEADNEAWGEISILPSPIKGTKRAVYKSFVVTILRQNGYFDEASSLTGPNKVDVTRKAEIKEFKENGQVDGDELWSHVNAQVSTYLYGLVPNGFEVHLTLVGFPQITSNEAVTAVNVDLSVFRNNYSGRMMVPVDLQFGGGTIRRYLFSVDIAFEGEVLVARTEFRPKEALGEARVTKEIQMFSSNPSDLFLPEYELEKYQAKSYIRAGDIVLKNNVELIPLKYKGEITKLYYKTGAITIGANVLLLEDAILGKMVRAKNLTSDKEVQGIVQADGTLVFKL